MKCVIKVRGLQGYCEALKIGHFPIGKDHEYLFLDPTVALLIIKKKPGPS